MKSVPLLLALYLLAGCATQKEGDVKQNQNNLSIQQLPEYTTAYVEYTGDVECNPEIYDVLLAELLEWAEPLGLWDFPGSTKLIMQYPDSQEVQAAERRFWLSITVPKDAQPSGNIRIRTIPSGKYAVGYFEVTAEEFGQAWGQTHSWISQNGYVPKSDKAAYEIQKNVSHLHPEQKHFIDICIPIE